MNTIIIWDTIGQDSIKFFIVDRDVSHLNQVYINEYTNKTETEKKAKIEELTNLAFNEGEMKLTEFTEFPVSSVGPNTKVIVCGFLP